MLLRLSNLLLTYRVFYNVKSLFYLAALKRDTSSCNDLPVWSSITPLFVLLAVKLGLGSFCLPLCLLSSLISNTWDRPRNGFCASWFAPHTWEMYEKCMRNVCSFLRYVITVTLLPFLPHIPLLEFRYFRRAFHLNCGLKLSVFLKLEFVFLFLILPFALG